MNRYRNDPRALQSLVEPDRVHRDVYIDPEVFQLEMERLWSRTWIYLGHTSQVPQPGDFITADIAATIGMQPDVLVPSHVSLPVSMNQGVPVIESGEGYDVCGVVAVLDRLAGVHLAMVLPCGM